MVMTSVLVVVVVDQGNMLCGVPPASQLAAPKRQAHVQCSSRMYRKNYIEIHLKVVGQWATVKQTKKKHGVVGLRIR